MQTLGFFQKTTLDWWVTFVFIIEKYLAFYVLYKTKYGLRLVEILQFIPLYTVLMLYKWSLIILNRSLFGSRMSPKIVNGNTVLCVCVLQLKEIYRNNSWREIQTVEACLSYVMILISSWLSYTLMIVSVGHFPKI